MRAAYHLGVILATMLLASAMSVTSSYAAEPGADILAKEKQGLILLLVKNQGVGIHTINLEVLSGEITSVKTARGWAVDTRASDSTGLTLTTTAAPVKAGERAVFFIGATETNTIISWSALDRFGATADSDDRRTFVRQMIERPAAPSTEGSASLSGMMSLSVITDKVIYNKDDKIIVSGTLQPDADFTITVYTPSGQKMKITDSTDSTGAFSVLHILQDAESGTYHLKVRQSEAKAETIFRVL